MTEPFNPPEAPQNAPTLSGAFGLVGLSNLLSEGPDGREKLSVTVTNIITIVIVIVVIVIVIVLLIMMINITTVSFLPLVATAVFIATVIGIYDRYGFYLLLLLQSNMLLSSLLLL